MAFNAGNAFITINPDMSSFQSDIKAKMAVQGDEAGKAFSGSFQEQLKAAFADLPKATVKAEADTAQLDADLEEATKDRTATVEADADTAKASAQLDELASKKRTAKIDVSEVLQKGGTLGDLLSPAGLGAAAGLALGPQAVGLAAGLAGVGAAFAAAGGEAVAFGAIAKPMFSDVAAAQKALTKAQDDYAKADNSADRAKALQAEQAALAKLTPAEKDLLTQLTALQKAWTALQKAEQPVVESALAPWLQTATEGIGLLSPIVEDGAGAFALLGSEAKAALQAPFWGTFANTFGTTGQIALVNFGEALGHVADGLAHLFTAFAPDIDKLPPLVNQLAAGFDNWARTVDDKGFNDFLSKTFTPENLKALAQDGKDLESLLKAVATASQDMSQLAFTGLGNVMTILGSLTPGEIEALTGLFLAIKTIGTISAGVSAVSSVIGKAKGLLGLGGQAAATAAEGSAAGTAAGESAATSFTAAFQAGVTAGLAEAFAAVGTEGETEAVTAGTTWGGSAAGAFSTALGGTDALGLAAVFTAIGAEGTAEAAGAGTAWGGAAAAAFSAALGGGDALGLTAVFAAAGTAGAVAAGAAGSAMGAAAAAGFATGIGLGGGIDLGGLVTAGVGAVVAAGVAGAALGAAVGTGFNTALSATDVSGATGKLASSVQAGAAAAATWLQPAGVQAGQGFISGFNSEASAIQASIAQVKTWAANGTAGSGTWIQPAGQQAGQGFLSGFESLKSKIDSSFGNLKQEVTNALPAPASWLVNAGISVVQGFLDGMISASTNLLNYASNLASSITNTIKSALNINSPSKVMIPVGSAVPEGLALGMTGGAHFVESAGSTLANVTAQSLAGIAVGQSAAALSALGVPAVAAAPRLPGVGRPLGAGPLQVAFTWEGSSDPVINGIVSGLQFYVQGATGGDVQGAFGQGPVRV